MPKAVFGGAAPIFRVANLSASLEYYVTVLGFIIDWEESAGIASVSRDRCCLFLCEGDQGNPGSWAWIGVGDVAVLFEQLRAKGARIRHPPTNYPWAYEMQVEDLDGNVLRLGSDPLKDRPFGEWLDMRGHAWVMAPGGGWTRVDRD
jgi:catechol 2,3-dioxygenase-like lactoylglutathione lyase family enzyme